MIKPFRSAFNQALQSTSSTPSAWAYRLLLGATGGSSLSVALMAMGLVRTIYGSGLTGAARLVGTPEAQPSA